MKAKERIISESMLFPGSALILTVVLTSMLAIVGVLFVMMARVDKVATSAISENRELNLGIETAIAKISQQLVSDIPGIAGQEYYDYPDANNAWLASLEPELIDDMGTIDPNDDIYVWRKISDITGYLAWRGFTTQNIDVRPLNLSTTKYVREYSEITLDGNGELIEQSADADGDGIVDSKWIELKDIISGTGKPIYAAIRIVDNQAMLNVNTAYRFVPYDPCAGHIDGSSQMQINLAGLARYFDDINDIDVARCGSIAPVSISNDWKGFQNNMIWRLGARAPGYLPFDMSDELELRYRSCLTSLGQTRLESVWYDTIGDLNDFQSVPYDGYRSPTSPPRKWRRLDDWKKRITEHPDACEPDRGHLLTTYNKDRIIDPNGDMMININRETSPWRIYDRLIRSVGVAPAIVPSYVRRQYAQLAANMADFVDFDDENHDGLLDANSVTTFVDPYDPCLPKTIYYGSEAQPFISEVGIVLRAGGPQDKSKPPVRLVPGDSSFALELYNPFDCNIPLRDFEIELFNRRSPSDIRIVTFDPCDIIYARSCVVITNRPIDFVIPAGVPVITRPGLIMLTLPDKSKPPVTSGFLDYTYDVFLKRRIYTTGTMIYVDEQMVYPYVQSSSSGLTTLSLGRCIRDWHVVYPTLAPVLPTLGLPDFTINPSVFHRFSFFLPNPLRPRARFVTVGDVPRILTLGHGTTRDSTIGGKLLLFSNEADVRLNLQDPLHKNVFQYLTVFDPNSDNIDNDADGLIDVADLRSPEVQVQGRININTAPWYVLAQLPWVSHKINQGPIHKLSQAIVAYRDKKFIPPAGPDYTLRFGSPGFGSIGELNFVAALPLVPDANYSIGQYGLDTWDLGTELLTHSGFPDLTTDGLGLGDGVPDDFEERDVIFSRISNLVSVRSDVFTAYILVRIGPDGPQKRVIAILDRSGVNKANVHSPDGKVRIVALHYVPDPR